MYEFIDLTAEQRHDRRALLDQYATLAQLSACLPILLIFSSNMISAGYNRWLRRPFESTRKSAGRESTPSHAPVRSSAADDEGAHDRLVGDEIDLDAEDVYGPSSPYVKHRSTTWSSRGPGNTDLWLHTRRVWHRAAWWCGEPVDMPFLDEYLGSRGEILGALLWFFWLVVVSFVQTGDDYLHLTKRFGIVAASQLPLHYLLSFKTPYSPLQLLIGRSHETLINAHQLLGRIMIVLFYAHTVLYLNFFIRKSLLLTKISELYIICGLIATLSFTAIATTALAPIRRWNYRLFYIAHVSLALALLPVLYFHVHHIRIYLYETAALYAIHVISRLLSSKTYSECSISTIPHTNIVQIAVPQVSTLDALAWQPGQHAYVSFPGLSTLSRPFRTANPFTVSSIPSLDDCRLRFVARIFDGNTAKILKHKTAIAPGSSIPLVIEGPYGLASHSRTLLSYNRVLFVAGGVGGTFITPLYRQLLADLSPSLGSARRQKVSFVWAVKSIADMLWAVPSEAREARGFAERLQVWVTQDVGGIPRTSLDGDKDKHASIDERAATAIHSNDIDQDDDIELEEHKTLLNTKASADESSGTTPLNLPRSAATSSTHSADLTIHVGRPDFTRIVDGLFSASSSPIMSDGSGAERIAIVVCGPRPLRRHLRKAVRRWVMGTKSTAPTHKDVWFWEEKFG